MASLNCLPPGAWPLGWDYQLCTQLLSNNTKHPCISSLSYLHAPFLENLPFLIFQTNNSDYQFSDNIILPPALNYSSKGWCLCFVESFPFAKSTCLDSSTYPSKKCTISLTDALCTEILVLTPWQVWKSPGNLVKWQARLSMVQDEDWDMY